MILTNNERNVNPHIKHTIPCETCNSPTFMTFTKRCDNCYEVERRIQEYLGNPRGVEFIRMCLEDLEK